MFSLSASGLSCIRGEHKSISCPTSWGSLDAVFLSVSGVFTRRSIRGLLSEAQATFASGAPHRSMRGRSARAALPAFGVTVSWSSERSTRIASLGDVASGGWGSSSAASRAILFGKVKSFSSGEKLSACDTAGGGEKPPSDDKSEHLGAALLWLPVMGTVLTADFFRGSEESRRADTPRGEARALGTVLGVISGRPESRRPAGVGKADVLAELTRLCEAGPEARRAGVLWTAALSTDVQDCGLCARENRGVELSGGSPVANLGILN